MIDEVDDVAERLEISREDAAELIEAERIAQEERAASRCEICRHWKPDTNAVTCDNGSKHPDGGLCLNPAYAKHGPAPMLSGDTCQLFEGKA